jgi:hypothetical protein
MLEEIAKNKKAKKVCSVQKSLATPITKLDWGGTKPTKLESDGNSWREQI